MNALVLSGGGARGAYQAGVLRAFVDKGFLDQTNAFDLIHGISVGAVNGCALAHFSKKDIGLGVKFLADRWNHTINSNKDIWRYRAPRINAPSIGDASQLHKYIDDNINHSQIMKSDVDLTISATRFRDGTCAIVDKHNPYFLQFVKASSAFPIYFPPVEIGGEVYIDGHLSDREPLSSVIKKGAKNILIIDTSKSSMRSKRGTIFSIVRDVIKIAIESFLYADYSKCVRLNHEIMSGRLIGKNYIDVIYVSPSRNLGGSLDFSKKSISHNYLVGYSDGTRIAKEYAFRCKQIE